MNIVFSRGLEMVNQIVMGGKTKDVTPDPVVGFGIWPVVVCAVIALVLCVVLWRASR